MQIILYQFYELRSLCTIRNYIFRKPYGPSINYARTKDEGYEKRVKTCDGDGGQRQVRAQIQAVLEIYQIKSIVLKGYKGNG